jgi:putative endonuclease
MPNKENNLTNSKKLLGSYGEKLALDYIRKQNYKLLGQNWRCRTGELDLIAEKEGVIVFIEVRTRRLTGTFGWAQESVDFRKRRQVKETAQVFLQRRNWFDRQIRFDVIAVHMDACGTNHQLEHIVNAF